MDLARDGKRSIQGMSSDRETADHILGAGRALAEKLVQVEKEQVTCGKPAARAGWSGITVKRQQDRHSTRLGRFMTGASDP